MLHITNVNKLQLTIYSDISLKFLLINNDFHLFDEELTSHGTKKKLHIKNIVWNSRNNC